MASQNEQAFRRWWWIVVVAFAIGVAGAFVSLQIAKPEYQASCKLFVAGRPDSGTGEGYQAAQFAQARVAAYMDLIKGARVAENAAKALGLNAPIQDVQGRISVSAAPESVIMTVSTVDPEAQSSADLANAVCMAFLAVAADAEGANPLVNVRIIEYANKPEYPIGPSKSRYLTVGALAGILAGLALVVALGRISPAAKSPAVETKSTPDNVRRQAPSPPVPANDAGEHLPGVGSHRYRDR
jgi:polysaccharide biosynthesis transport protein